MLGTMYSIIRYMSEVMCWNILLNFIHTDARTYEHTYVCIMYVHAYMHIHTELSVCTNKDIFTTCC